jgi:hypothetical protein|tara:strand:+ start:365 stop:949 length:585 start_codon:yes stop_codon:yes gene_type:complete
MNLTTETYAVIPEYTQEVINMAMDYLYQEEDYDHLYPFNLEHYIKKIDDWGAVSFYKKGSETVGFASAQMYHGGARLMSRMYKSPAIRNNSKIPLTAATKQMVHDQYSIVKNTGINYVFMSRENNPKSFINYSKSFDWCEWKIPEKRFLVGSDDARWSPSSWQFIMYSEIVKEENIEEYLESMTEEEYNETIKT